ncbi:monovalent cation/H(+) antiporter subunit G [uncultured Cohaesibacter sp.]|uniref:monovalent cation/H(+) antiporter subunit G n=1 Tax=uncultured Cohaesibacter sp. TaxID=1002546 RepID=UPI00292F53D1|nr:monovalent cation/H(+) antiporter subunit G [uncultured Cohaesibacter sp.]
MTDLLPLIGGLIIFLGTLFLLLGGLGLFRMPDSYTRIQAGTKATTLGTLLTLLGAAIVMPGWFIKLLLIVVFIMFTNPLSSHFLARAAHRAKLKPEAYSDHLADHLAASLTSEEGEKA